MRTSFSIYFAGELFSLKHLLGNALLAEQIHKQSEGKYECVVPQDLEQRDTSAIAIRDQDLLHVVRSDLGIFHFDGPELDSGTVVEYMVAKMLDIPSILLRTDFRKAGDSDGDPWNLMCIGYPRTKVIVLDGMALYQESTRRHNGTIYEGAVKASADIATQLIQGLDEVRGMKPVFAPNEIESVYKWAQTFPGESFRECLTEPLIQEILLSKRSKGLIV